MTDDRIDRAAPDHPWHADHPQIGIGTGTRITDALLEDGWSEGCILDLELAADGSVARARRRYPNRVTWNYPEAYLYSAGLWGDHLVLVGTTDPQSTFLDAPPPRPGEYQTPFFVIEPTSPRAESTRAQ